MTTTAEVTRGDAAIRDLSGKSYIIGQNLSIDMSEGKIILGNSSQDGLELDGGTKRIVAGDGTNNRVLMSGADGVIKVSDTGVNVLTAANSDLTFLSTFRQLRESFIHTGGGNTFTNVAPYVSIDDFLAKIDFDDWVDMNWYFQASFKAGTGTAKVRLRNTTAGATVADSEITTTSTSYVMVRSGELTKPSGDNTFVVQYGHTPSGGGSDFINLTIAQHVFRRPQ